VQAQVTSRGFDEGKGRCAVGTADVAGKVIALGSECGEFLDDTESNARQPRYQPYYIPQASLLMEKRDQRNPDKKRSSYNDSQQRY